MSHDPLIDFDTDDAVAEAIAMFDPYIQRKAARMAARYSTEAEELVQEAHILLWRLDPTRFDAADVEYLRRQINARMHVVAKGEVRQSGGEKREYL